MVCLVMETIIGLTSKRRTGAPDLQHRTQPAYGKSLNRIKPVGIRQVILTYALRPCNKHVYHLGLDGMFLVSTLENALKKEVTIIM